MSTPVPVALAVAAFRGNSGITARVPAAQIGTQLHGVYPAIRLTQLGGPGDLVSATGQPVIQWEVWGDDPGTTAEWAASQTAQIIHDAIEANSLHGRYTGVGVVAAVWTESSPSSQPDPATARVRYLGTLGMYSQPEP